MSETSEYIEAIAQDRDVVAAMQTLADYGITTAKQIIKLMALREDK